MSYVYINNYERGYMCLISNKKGCIGICSAWLINGVLKKTQINCLLLSWIRPVFDYSFPWFWLHCSFLVEIPPWGVHYLMRPFFQNKKVFPLMPMIPWFSLQSKVHFYLRRNRSSSACIVSLEVCIGCMSQLSSVFFNHTRFWLLISLILIVIKGPF